MQKIAKILLHIGVLISRRRSIFVFFLYIRSFEGCLVQLFDSVENFRRTYSVGYKTFQKRSVLFYYLKDGGSRSSFRLGC